jgi:5'-nucleotidase
VEYASTTECCDIIIGGHTHVVMDSVVNNVVIGQTGRKLKSVGATTIRLKGNKITSIDYRNIPLASYAKDSTVLALVERIEDNPALKVSVGQFATAVSHVGFADLLTRSLAEAMGTQLAFYHYGGIRLAEHSAGDIRLSTIYNLEPFESKIHTITMTPAQLRAMIIAKYNDTQNPKESHRVDLFCNTPYDIVLDGHGEAVDVRFPKLKDGRKYSVAMADYIGKKYPAIEGENRAEHNILVTDVVLDYLRRHPNTQIDNHQYQKRVKR